MKYLLDTNILIYARKNMGRCRQRIDQYVSSDFAISALGIEEMTCGLVKSGFPKSLRKYIEDVKSIHAILSFDAEIADLPAMRQIPVSPQRLVQDYLSACNDIRDWLRRQKEAEAADQNTTDWDDVVFEVDLLKSQEINLDYILELIFEHNRKIRNKTELVETIRRIIRATIDSRAKEGLIVDFINETDLDAIADKAGVIAAFFEYAQLVQKKEAEDLIAAESLNAEEARRYIAASLERGYASENGTGLNNILPKMSPLNPQYLTRKQAVFRRISAFVEKFKGVGGKI